MQKFSKMGMLTIFVIVALSYGCGTTTPNAIEDKAASFDSSTPADYSAYNSGLISVIKNERGENTHCIVTDHWVGRYNILISKYRFQLKQDKSVLLSQNDGVTDYDDQKGNHLHKVGIEYYGYFLKLNRWEKEKRPEDSLWMKAKGIAQ